MLYIIDILHLFLRVADVLINLLIRDLRILDGIEKATTILPDRQKDKNMRTYEDFLNGPCKIRFKWYLDDSNKFAYRDLTGPEKHRLFNNIDIPMLFPGLHSKIELQEVWTTFIKLTTKLANADSSDADEFDSSAKSWVRDHFLKIYQMKYVTPYMHAFAMHIPQFLCMETLVSLLNRGLRN